MTEFHIRPARDDDVPQILDLLRVSLGETPLLRRTPELWRWKHMENPFGASIVLVAEKGDRIAGVRAMMRWRMTTADNRTLTCLRPVDTATHPAFSRRGIFRDLTMTALDVARAEAVDLVFNTPNEKSMPGYLDMGWSGVSRLGVLVRPRFGHVLKPSPNRAPSISRIAPEMARAEESSIEFDDRRPRGLRTPRTMQYLHWRFCRHPTASYGWVSDESGGGLIARANNRARFTELVISDLLGSPRPDLIKFTSDIAQVRYLAGWFSPGSPERRTAMSAGMIPLPWVRTLQLVALPLHDLGLDVLDLRSWDLATSDLELL